MTFGERLKSLRTSLGLDQKQLAENLNLNSSSISNWETNRRSPDLDTLCLLADFFNVTTDYLLCRTDIKNYDINNQEYLILKLDKTKYPYGLTQDELENKLDLLFKLQKTLEEFQQC